MAAAANDQVSSEKENMLPNEISEEENERFLKELPSSSSSSRRRIDFTNHMSANYLHFAVSRHWRSRSAPDNNLDSADWEMPPAKALKQGKEEYGKQLWHQNSNSRKKHLYLSGRRAALEHDVTQLQMQLQDEKFMRRDLEMAMGQASGAVSPGHQHFVGQTMELTEEIYSLEEEVRGLEQRLLILYRNFFHEFLAAYPSSQNPKMVPSASTDNDRKRERNTLSRVLFTPSKSPSSLGCSHISSATQSSHKENLQPLLKSRQDSFSSDLCSVDQRCHSLEHQNSPRMQEGDCKDLSTMNQNNAVPLTLKDYFYKSPNRLSEELVRCMSVIYCKLSDPPLRQSGIVLSPSSSVSSTSISSPHDAVSEGWSPRWKTQSFSDTPLKDPYKVKDDIGDAGPYSSMVEIPWICVDKDRLTYVTGMLRTFRSMVEHLEKVDPTPMERNAKLAFWINIYNALVMHAYLAYGIPRNNMRRMQLFQRASYKVGGYSISANSIEQSILCCKMSRSAQWLQALLSTGTRFKTGEERRTFGRTFGLDGSEPLVCFALCSGAFSDPGFLSTNHQRTVCSLNVAKPISKCISIPKPNTSMLSCCGFSTLGVQNSMAWNMGSHRIIQAKDLHQRRRLRAVAEDTELVSEGTQEEQQVAAVVSQSDKLTMFFKADGTIAESLVMKVSQALQALEDVSDVKVETLEGITTVELVKQTTVQATGVSSGLVEMLLGMDFKLQSLCLSFEDEEDEEGWV